MWTQPAFKLFLAIGASLAAGACAARQATPAAGHGTQPPGTEATSTTRPQAATLTRGAGMVMLDHQVIRVPDAQDIDLMGFHLLNKMNDWLYLGVGAHAPVFNGEYGGFMAFDVTAHVQRKIYGNVFADAGVSLGGGGGGKSVEQSKVLSGTGGFIKSYVGLGYDFQKFSVGANVSWVKFHKSAINNSQLNVYVHFPFSHATGPYASSGDRFVPAGTSGGQGFENGAGENTLTVALDNYSQIDPQGSNKGAINVVDLQFSHFMTKSAYWYFSLGVGYRGMPLYNQLLGGVGYRVPVSPRVNVYGQLGVGSGGYAPERIDTGSGLLVYPKVSAEYLLNRNFGVALSAGHLRAPKGSSKNHTLGVSLNYRLHSGGTGAGTGADNAAAGVYRGYRLSLSQQTEFNVKVRGGAVDKVHMLSAQIDHVVSDHFYIPIRAGVAYNAYLGYPGYGELAAGVGLQNRYAKGDRFQFFGQLLAGTNVHGPIVKAGLGLNYGLSDRLAVHAIAGQTMGVDNDRFRSVYAGLGVTYRFSVPTL